jgi:outer membrane protein, heavy metal efflux system
MNLLFWALAVSQAAQGAPVTESDAISRALKKPALESLLQGREDLARADVTAVGLWPNPEVAYDREQIFGDQAAAEEAMTVTQRLTLLGRRKMKTQAREYRVKATRLQNSVQRAGVVAETKRHFYQVIYRQGRVTAVDRLKTKLKDALEVVRQREKAGEASRYDRRRLERELRIAHAEFKTETIERESAWMALLALAPGLNQSSTWPRLSGGLLPADSAVPSAEMIDRRPNIRALEALTNAARRERDAAERNWIPDFGITGGWRSQSDTRTRDHGFSAGLSLSIPLFDRGQGEHARAQARVGILSSQQQLETALRERVVEKLRYRSTEFYRAAQAFRAEDVNSSEELSQIAEAAYKGGELGLLELLDAHRGAAADELLHLKMQHTARIARIELDGAMGVLP